jgi:AraC-like DNA-binding protein
MKYRYILPSEPLKDYIDYYLIIEQANGDNKPVEVFPSPQAEMVFTYGDAHASYSVIGTGEEHLTNDYAISGFFTQKATYRNQHNLGVIMVGFKPWGIQPFTGFSVSEITDYNLSLKDVYPAKIRVLEDEIRFVKSAEERIAVIERFLLDMLRYPKNDRLIRESIIYINQSQGQATIKSLAKKFHLCEKQFKRRFVQSVGIQPKLFSRIVRFQHVLTLLNSMQVGLLDVAIRSGFYDEAHFIREFERFAVTTPKQYLINNQPTALGEYMDEQLKKSLFYNIIYR